MGREKRHYDRILKKITQQSWTIAAIITTLCVIAGCSKEENADRCRVSVSIDTGTYTCKSIDPEESKVTDISIMVFDEYGRAEATAWITGNTSRPYSMTLTSGRKYRFVACVNFGYRINLDHASALTGIKYHMAYPDEYRNGIPMYADTGYILVKDACMVHMKLTRLMSKISIRIDRNRLSEDVRMRVVGARVGNCPKVTHVFKSNSASSSDDCFASGFNKSEDDCGALNRMESIGISYPISLYMLENMQGAFSDAPISKDSEKVFATYDPRRETCSYIELDIDYISPTTVSSNGPLQYRFYLGENLNDLNVERNCHYLITISPEDDGLKEDSWRVDKSGLTQTAGQFFSYYPESYIRGNIGDKIHIGCIFTPEDAPFDVGMEYMENDKKEGIYDYTIDEDGHGAVLTLTGPGSGLIYMSAGAPVNESALWFIEVNLPQDGF